MHWLCWMWPGPSRYPTITECWCCLYSGGYNLRITTDYWLMVECWWKRIVDQLERKQLHLKLRYSHKGSVHTLFDLKSLKLLPYGFLPWYLMYVFSLPDRYTEFEMTFTVCEFHIILRIDLLHIWMCAGEGGGVHICDWPWEKCYECSPYLISAGFIVSSFQTQTYVA